MANNKLNSQSVHEKCAVNITDHNLCSYITPELKKSILLYADVLSEAMEYSVNSIHNKPNYVDSPTYCLYTVGQPTQLVYTKDNTVHMYFFIQSDVTTKMS